MVGAASEKRHLLARQIGVLVRELVEVFGEVKPADAEPGQFLVEYEDSRVHAVWTGPKDLLSKADYQILVFFKRPFAPRGRGFWPVVIRTTNSDAPTFECSTQLGEEVLTHLRRVAGLKCYCCDRPRPPYEKGWFFFDTNLVDASAPEKVACSRECVARWARRPEGGRL